MCYLQYEVHCPKNTYLSRRVDDAWLIQTSLSVDTPSPNPNPISRRAPTVWLRARVRRDTPDPWQHINLFGTTGRHAIHVHQTAPDDDEIAENIFSPTRATHPFSGSSPNTQGFAKAYVRLYAKHNFGGWDKGSFINICYICTEQNEHQSIARCGELYWSCQLGS